MLGCPGCGGSCGGSGGPPPLTGLSRLDFSKPTNGNYATLTREIGDVSSTAKYMLTFQAIASLAAAGLLAIQWMTYCENKKRNRSRSKR